MAITKKLNTKKTISKVKSSVKKSLVKKTHPKQAEAMRSFRISPDTLPFFGVQVTKQTVYWSALLIFIMIMQLWILNIQLDVIKVTDSITALH